MTSRCNPRYSSARSCWTACGVSGGRGGVALAVRRPFQGEHGAERAVTHALRRLLLPRPRTGGWSCCTTVGALATGGPVSAQPFLTQMCSGVSPSAVLGVVEAEAPRLQARAAFDVGKPGGRQDYLRVTLEATDDGLLARKFPSLK